MQTETVKYQLKYDNFGNPRKYALPKKRRLKIIDNSSWIEAETKNQWYYKDYRCYYIVIGMFKPEEYSISLSGYSLKKKYKTLEEAKLASLKYCDKLLK